MDAVEDRKVVSIDAQIKKEILMFANFIKPKYLRAMLNKKLNSRKLVLSKAINNHIRITI